MPLRQTIFIVLAILALLLALLSFDRVTSIVPGWHTTIQFGPTWHHFLFPVLLLAVSILYRRIALRDIFVSRAFFVSHVLFTVIVYFIANFGVAVSYLFFDVLYDLQWMLFLVNAAWWAQWIVLAGQIVFATLLWFKLTSRPQIPQPGI
ncbi:MAG: hypothetical protein J7621_18895 [Niastella sp.]|nr:hypothetical protein [Niastella sp.]